VQLDDASASSGDGGSRRGNNGDAREDIILFIGLSETRTMPKSKVCIDYAEFLLCISTLPHDVVLLRNQQILWHTPFCLDAGNLHPINRREASWAHEGHVRKARMKWPVVSPGQPYRCLRLHELWSENLHAGYRLRLTSRLLSTSRQAVINQIIRCDIERDRFNASYLHLDLFVDSPSRLDSAETGMR